MPPLATHAVLTFGAVARLWPARRWHACRWHACRWAIDNTLGVETRGSRSEGVAVPAGDWCDRLPADG